MGAKERPKEMNYLHPEIEAKLRAHIADIKATKWTDKELEAALGAYCELLAESNGFEIEE
jgi:hypothetical protein